MRGPGPVAGGATFDPQPASLGQGYRKSGDMLYRGQDSGSPAIEIMAFIPEKSVDPLFYDKAYLLAPDKRGGKPYALLAEAMRLVGEGYVSPADLDKTVRDGLGLRWSFMGPFATIELNAPLGVDDYRARYVARNARLEREAGERAAELEAKKAALGDARISAVQAAILRARAKKAGGTAEGGR